MLIFSIFRTLCWNFEKSSDWLVPIHHSPARFGRQSSSIHLGQNVRWWKCTQLPPISAVRDHPFPPCIIAIVQSSWLISWESSSIGAFQKWADEVGDQSYTFDSLLPFFKRSVHFHAPNASTTPSNVSLPYNGYYFSSLGGPLQIAFPGYFNAISSWLGNAFTELGFARLPGFSDGRLFGWSYFTYSVDPASQTRSSSESSFLREALRETTNLNFYKSTQVKKILLDDCKTATGVLVSTAGVEYTISAAREVILSAGAVGHSTFSCPTSASFERKAYLLSDYLVPLPTATDGLRHRSSVHSKHSTNSCLRRSSGGGPKHVGQYLLRPNVPS